MMVRTAPVLFSRMTTAIWSGVWLFSLMLEVSFLMSAVILEVSFLLMVEVIWSPPSLISEVSMICCWWRRTDETA